MKFKALLLLALTCAAGLVVWFMKSPTTVSLATWRNDDFVIWHSVLIPPFEQDHHGTRIEYNAYVPNFAGRIRQGLEQGKADDVIACYPGLMVDEFSDAGHYASLEAMIDMSPFSQDVLDQWRSKETGLLTCLPVAAVGHGFLYNKQIFAELGLEPPRTWDEFFTILDTVRTDGRYTPMSLGLKDGWVAVAMGLELVGPSYWHGDQGLSQMQSGEITFDGPEFEATLRNLAKWSDYLEDRPFATGRLQALTAFEEGKVAILPTGSWDLPLIRAGKHLEFGAFAAPTQAQGQTCYVTWHNDLGFALNAKSDAKDHAVAFLNYMTSQTFLTEMETHLSGFYAILSDRTGPLEVPLAQEFRDLRQKCEPTQRLSVNRFFNLTGAQYEMLQSGILTAMASPSKIDRILKEWSGTGVK